MHKYRSWCSPLVLDVAAAADGILLHNGANVVKAMRLMREEASDVMEGEWEEVAEQEEDFMDDQR